MNAASGTPRHPGVAVVLSLFCPGLGHLYCGAIAGGLVLFLLSFLFAPAAVLAAYLPPAMPVLVGLILSFLTVVGVYLFAVVDSFRLARRHKGAYELREYNRALIYVLFILVGVTYPIGIIGYLRSHVFEGFYYPVTSMAPSILNGDHVLVNKAVTAIHPPKRGDLVVFKNPRNRQQTFLQRVIGLPGDSVAVRGQEVFVNGKKLERDRMPASSLGAIQAQITGPVFQEANAGRRYSVMLSDGGQAIPDYPEAKVPEGSCFVLGDNRDVANDSRGFGFVPLNEILGFVQYIYYPAETWARFGPYQD
jgi:signal peptidase I